MPERLSVATVLSSVLALLLVTGAAEAQYRYGKTRSRGYGGGEQQGLFLFVEGAVTNPRNADNVVATEISGSTLLPIVPVWDEDVAGRVGAGWRWASGGELALSYWTYETELEASGTTSLGGVLAFAIGPPIALGGGDFAGDVGSPGFFDVDTEVMAETLDLAWSRHHELTDSFRMGWTLGARLARFEEHHAGAYDESGAPDGVNSFAAFKHNEGTMYGARVGARGTYRLGAFSLSSGLAFSWLDGELEAASSLVPTGTSNGSLAPSVAAFSDDGRSGTIRDFDVAVAWHLASDRWRLSLAWEQAEWRDIAGDLVRNFPGTAAPLRDRDSVVFSGVRLGVRVDF